MSELVRPLSTFYVLALIHAVENGAAQNPTALPVEIALTLTDPVTDDDFVTASWETAATTPPVYYARCLVGPSGSGAAIEVDRGRYRVYSRVTGAQEVPVLAHGYILFT